MKISVTRGGGFAGLVTTRTVTSESLSPDDANTLRKKVEEAFRLSASLGSQKKLPDSYDYAVTVEDDEGHKRTLALSEENLSEPIWALISWIDALPAVDETIGPPT
jgi:hypothetical protein